MPSSNPKGSPGAIINRDRFTLPFATRWVRSLPGLCSRAGVYSKCEFKVTASPCSIHFRAFRDPYVLCT